MARVRPGVRAVGEGTALNAMRHWPIAVPLAALAMLGVSMAVAPTAMLSWTSFALLIGAVIAAVHHAEVVAHKVGEPFGTLVLALAVTAIELALLVSLMLVGGESKSELPRDTVFATVMIISNGVVGLCILVGALRHQEQSFRIEGVGPAFAALVTLATLVLVLPGFTTSAPGPLYNVPQLVFVAVSSLVLWLVFVFFQTVRNRDYFLPPADPGDEDIHAPKPGTGRTWASFALLLVALAAVVGLAKALSPIAEAAVRDAGLPTTLVGVVIALVVLLPETVAAIRAALADRLQTSMNLAIGSALASIGLTIPLVVVVAMWIGMPLRLGLDAKDIVLLALTAIVGTIGIGSGRTNMMQGAVHLLVFFAWLFLAAVP